jgi:hypothetical protein
LTLVTIMSIALLATQFSLNVGEAILALFLGFIFSFIGVQCSGHTDINPVGTVAKVRFRLLQDLTLLNTLCRHPNWSLAELARVQVFPSLPPRLST